MYQSFGKEIEDSRNAEVSVLMQSADREIFSCLLSRHICLFSMSLSYSVVNVCLSGYAENSQKNDCDAGFQVSEVSPSSPGTKRASKRTPRGTSQLCKLKCQSPRGLLLQVKLSVCIPTSRLLVQQFHYTA